MYKSSRQTPWNMNFLQEKGFDPSLQCWSRLKKNQDTSLDTNNLLSTLMLSSILLNVKKKKKKEKNRGTEREAAIPLHPFLTIKALNLTFLMFPLQKKEREQYFCLEWLDILPQLFALTQNAREEYSSQSI